MAKHIAVVLVFVFATLGILVFFGKGAEVLDAINMVVSFVETILRQVGAL